MERDRDDVYDPVVVLDEEGDLVGTITMRDLLTHSTRLSVQLAANANPLTGLPGNAMIQQWMQEAVAAPPFSVIYGDLDNFKEYNDSYGFPQGDQMIKLAANTLADWAERVLGDANLGHVGGDDFVLVTRDVVCVEPLRRVCEDFDRLKGALFSTEDARNGFYTAVDRRGESIRVPLVTMSLAAVTSNSIGQNPFPGMVGQVAASVKKKVKALNADRGRSGYLIERRQYM
jgi:diguanylate cyclase (GGDEF)-like protein